QEAFRAPGTDVCRLADGPAVIEPRLGLEDSVDGAPVDQQPLPEAGELHVHDLGREPTVRDRRQRRAQAAQLRVLTRQVLVAHRAQLEVPLPRLEARILRLELVAALEAPPDGAPRR